MSRITAASTLIPLIKQASLTDWAANNKPLAGALLGAAGGAGVQGLRRLFSTSADEDDQPSYLNGALAGGLLGALGGASMRPQHTPAALAAAKADGMKANPFNAKGMAQAAQRAFDNEVTRAIRAAQGAKGSPLTEAEAMLAVKHLPVPRAGAQTGLDMANWAQSMLAGDGALSSAHNAMLADPAKFQSERLRDLVLGLIGQGGSPLLKLPE